MLFLQSLSVNIFEEVAYAARSVGA